MKKEHKVYEDLIFSLEKLKRSYTHVVFVKGRAGTGKSYQIKKYLDDNEIKYVRITGDISEGYFYRFLYEHNSEIIWVNDSVKLLKNQGTLNMIKSITELNGQRLITKHTYNSQETELPQEFICESKFIFDFNSEVPKRLMTDFNALTSRGEFVDIIMSNKDIMNLSKEIFTEVKQKYVLGIIEKILQANPYVKIDIRTIEKAFTTKELCDDTNNTHRFEEFLRRKICGSNKIRSEIYEMIGTNKISLTEFKKLLFEKRYVGSLRTAHRRIKEWLELEYIEKADNLKRNYKIKIKKN